MAKKSKLVAKVVGKQDDTTILSGEFIFKMMDTHGMSLDIINEILRIKGFAFDISGFILAAKQSKNYSKERLKVIIKDNAPLDVDRSFYTKVDQLVDTLYSD